MRFKVHARWEDGTTADRIIPDMGAMMDLLREWADRHSNRDSPHFKLTTIDIEGIPYEVESDLAKD